MKATARILVAGAALLLLAGCSSWPNLEIGKPVIKIAILTAPEWEASDRVFLTGAELGAEVAGTFNQAWTGTEPKYVAIPQEVMRWAGSQVFFARRQAADQVKWHMMKKYDIRIGPRTSVFPGTTLEPVAGDPQVFTDWVDAVTDDTSSSEQLATLARWAICLRYGVPTYMIPIGMMDADQQKEWAFMPAGGERTMVWYYAIAENGARGLKVVEAQNGEEIDAIDYINPVLKVFPR